ncbi:hypothetical protein AOQ84DRAFT_267592, partial [Glonium stellatum]
MSHLSNLRKLGDLPICVAIDKSGSTWGATLKEEIAAVKKICSLLSSENKNPIRLLPWSDEALDPINLPEQLTAMENLDPGGGTKPSVLYSGPALEALKACGLWFLLTDGEVQDGLVQEFALRTSDLGLHSLACIVVVFGSTSSGPPITCNISVGVAVYAVAPDFLFLFQDIQTGILSVMQAKGCFKELLPKSNSSYAQPIIGKYTAWAELPRIRYEDLSNIQIGPPQKIGADELALQDGLVVTMKDIFSEGADPGVIGEIVKNEDNLKSIVLAEMTRGTGRHLGAWLLSQQQPTPQLTQDRPDIDGKAQQAVTRLLDGLRDGDEDQKIEEYQTDLRNAHERNWHEFQGVLYRHIEAKASTDKTNQVLQCMSKKSETLISEIEKQAKLPASERSSSWHASQLSTSDDCGENSHRSRPDVGELLNSSRFEERKPDVLYLPGFKRRLRSPDSEFSGRCMLCSNTDSILAIMLKTAPNITTSNFPRQGSYSHLTFPLAMGHFAETDVISFFICCDACALYLVRNCRSPLPENITGALGLVSVTENKTTWLETLNIALKGRFDTSDLPALFIAALDRMISRNKVRIAAPEDKLLCHNAFQWAKYELCEIARLPETLSSHFSQGQGRGPGERKLSLRTFVVNHASLLDPGDEGNKDVPLLRYSILGFMVIISLMQDHHVTPERLQTYMFQRLIYHITEAYLGKLKSGKVQIDVDKLLYPSGLESTNTLPRLKHQDVLTTVSIEQLLNCNLLDTRTLESFRSMEVFEDVEKQTGPAIAVYLHRLSGFAAARAFEATNVSPVDYFNSVKANPLMQKVILTPLAISKGLSADLIS